MHCRAKAWSSGKYADCIDHFTRAIDLSRDNAEFSKIIYSNRSAAYLKIGRSSEALIDADKCLQIDSSWSKGLIRKGDALMVLKRYPEATQIFEELLVSSPQDNNIRTKLEQIRAATYQSSNSNPFTTASPASTVLGKPYDFTSTMFMVHTYMRMAIVVCGFCYMIPIRMISTPCHK